MSTASRLRDSTQILLPADAIDGLSEDLTDRFTVTIRREQSRVRIIGSPVEIKQASAFLTRNGVAVE
ncbi:hypothetical protein HLRTI_000137 [Halorhabdus tiamatea SARL4B]|uniref:Uncharacterized protein n=1 Tax=Halorhabdus tiamatea SARL4B TaxID=1033806 RepID=F7PGI7_9EURY|nr:hypothetical protein [Halorhabdus tiamatea]ERJ07763.1 hypothetical protein HLRTI_000137 [Halorhabdus tiamatea SARL4B]CCQ32578.1 conserved hypothetical protein [Halorhabdus tiamatea SARL4B]